MYATQCLIAKDSTVIGCQYSLSDDVIRDFIIQIFYSPQLVVRIKDDHFKEEQYTQ